MMETEEGRQQEEQGDDERKTNHGGWMRNED